MTADHHLPLLPKVAEADVQTLLKKEKEYGSSWKRRGGVGAFMMLARKWDRLEEQVKRHGWDVFEAAAQDPRTEGLLDDLGDLRRYLLLVEAEILTRRTPKPHDVDDVDIKRIEEWFADAKAKLPKGPALGGILPGELGNPSSKL